MKRYFEPIVHASGERGKNVTAARCGIFGQKHGVAEWVVCSVVDTEPSILDRDTEWVVWSVVDTEPSLLDRDWEWWCVVLQNRSRHFWT